MHTEQTSDSPAMTAQQRKFTECKNPLRLYKEILVGKESSILFFMATEISFLLFKNLNGIIGLGCRYLFYQPLFKSCGKGAVISANVTIRQPQKISVGSKVILDENVVLDVRGENSSITIGDNVTIGRYTIITAKNGHINISKGANIGTSCRIATQSKIEIGESVLIAAYSYIGPGNHKQEDADVPLIESAMDVKGGVVLGDRCWIGTHSTVLDGVNVGKEAIVGAHSLVKDSVPEKTTVFGVPARSAPKAK